LRPGDSSARLRNGLANPAGRRPRSVVGPASPWKRLGTKRAPLPPAPATG